MKKKNAGKRSPDHCLCTVCGICHLHLLFQFLRVLILILEKKLGTESEASIILTLMMLMGIAAGVYFGKLTMWWKEKLPGLGCLMLGRGCF